PFCGHPRFSGPVRGPQLGGGPRGHRPHHHGLRGGAPWGHGGDHRDGGRLPVQHGAHPGGHPVRSRGGPAGPRGRAGHPGQPGPAPGRPHPAGQGPVFAPRGLRKGSRGMRKTGHRARREELSAGRIEYIEAARQRLRSRRIRRTMLLVALVAAAVIYMTGLVNTSVMLLEDMADTVRIALMPEQGFPQQTGAGAVYQAETLGGSFVVLGEEGCTVFSNGGGRLDTVGTGYAHPALAAGGNSFVLYNRSGSEPRVESRTRELYTRQTEGHIYLCALSDRGELAVVTDDVRKLALLTVYDANRNELLTWSTTTAEGVPLRMDFSPDGTQLAIAAVTAQDGQMVTNLYLLNLRAGEPQLLASEPGSTPLALTWCSNDRLLAVCDTHAALYGSDGSAQGRYDFGGQDVAALS